MNSESGRGGRIRTGDPLRPSATSCNYPQLPATSEPQVVHLLVDLWTRPPVPQRAVRIGGCERHNCRL